MAVVVFKGGAMGLGVRRKGTPTRAADELVDGVPTAVGDGVAVMVPKASRRPVAGPTIRSHADLRRARDLLMVVARACGYNRFDLELLFDISPNHANARLATVRAFAKAATADEEGESSAPARSLLAILSALSDGPALGRAKAQAARSSRRGL